MDDDDDEFAMSRMSLVEDGETFQLLLLEEDVEPIQLLSDDVGGNDDGLGDVDVDIATLLDGDISVLLPGDEVNDEAACSSATQS